MKKAIIFLLTIFLLSNISATCQENQININTASLTELDQLTGIGAVKAQAIIDARPFNSVDDLIDVNGIGEITLQNIKTQNLACVEDNTSQDKQETEEPPTETSPHEEDSTEEETISLTANTIEEIPDDKTQEPIHLNSQTQKTIKTENNRKINKNTYLIYGFVGFCVLLTGLFLLKKNKIQKTEFQNE